MLHGYTEKYEDEDNYFSGVYGEDLTASIDVMKYRVNIRSMPV